MRINVSTPTFGSELARKYLMTSSISIMNRVGASRDACLYPFLNARVSFSGKVYFCPMNQS